jgi:hypothetical protein
MFHDFMSPFEFFDVVMRALIVHRLLHGFKLSIGCTVPPSSASAITPPPALPLRDP